jgi:anti-sigma factor RsiW
LKLPQFRMAGEQLSFKLDVPAGAKTAAYQFRGWVKGDVIEGNVTVGDGSGQRVQPWSAKRTVRAEPNMGAAGAAVVGARQ